ncbi:MAG: hypothetical protein M3Q99_20270 [Acidobacteriota bacterium]|nr:hypothetical protein [Acidobacteriota bacterium]
MSIEERVSKSERKIETVEDAIKLLSKLIANHDERLYDSLKGREDLNEKITMLIDAQIRNEDAIQKVNQHIDKLAELVAKSHQRLDRLES